MQQFKKLLLITFIIANVWSCQNKKAPNANKLASQNIDTLMRMMTLEEKIDLLHASSSFTSGGVARLGIPEIVMSDGPHGVRMEHGRDWQVDNNVDDAATYLPTGICLASTWNKELGYEYGSVLGSEANERGKDIILGPGINIIRSPLNGRNFEYLSEDPYLASQMCVGYIKGVQDQGVGACAKHFVANNQETERHIINTHVSDRALREIYLPAFKTAVQDAGVLSIMSAYNKLNGTYCSSNEYLLDKILRKEFGFNGIVISDWAAVHETDSTLKYGCDIEMGTDLKQMPNPKYDKFYLANAALEKVKNGEISEEYVNKKVRRILHVMQKANCFGNRPTGERNTEQHHKIALKVAEEGIVLLKNENILPITRKVKTIAVIGDNATALHAQKGGSSQVKAQYEITPLQGIKNVAADNYNIMFAQGYKVTRKNSSNKELLEEAVNIAKKADLVIFVGGWIHGFDHNDWGEGTFDSEALDKTNFDLMFGQEELLNAIIEVNPNLVSVIFGGSSVKFGAWSDHSKAILQAWYPGMEGGNALANILFGKVNPSGKLPVSFANDYVDYPDHALGEYPGNGKDVVYNDDIFVGYRYFDTYKKEVAFPFGHGLSYTSFEYSNMKIDKSTFDKNEKVKVSVTIKNTGAFDGAEIVQLYVSDKKSELKRPAKELKAFEKVFLKQKEIKTLVFELNKDAFSYYHPNKGWVLEPGDFEILIGSSSKDIRQSKTLHIN